jgi:hypothetical protein
MLKVRLLVDLEGYKKEQPWPVLRYYSSTCKRIPRKIMKNRARTKNFRVENFTHDLQNTKQER